MDNMSKIPVNDNPQNPPYGTTNIKPKEEKKIKKEYIKSIFDGMIQAFLLRLLVEFAISIYLLEQIEMNLILVAILVAFSLISFVFLVIKNAKKSILIKSVVSFIAFIIFNILSFLILSVRILPMREISDADGILVLLFAGIYLAFVVISRIITLVIIFITQKYKVVKG